jgi:hypothetical protein
MNDTPKPSNLKPLKPKAYMDAIVNHRVIHRCDERDDGGCAELNQLRAAYDQAMDAMSATPTVDDYGRAKRGDAQAIEKINRARRDLNRLRKPDEQLPMILTDEQQFIARMIREYKAQLVDYVSCSQNYIDEYADDNPNSGGVIYWRAELIEATRRLELSDDELLKFIKPDRPHRLVKVKL